MYKSVVYEGEKLVGEADLYPMQQNKYMMRELRINYYSQSSERCPPLAVLHTITTSTTGLCFKMESLQQPLLVLHSSCLRENKTAVISLGQEELHLVAMQSRKNGQCACFWGYNVASGLYDSCLVMLNLRCLAIVFDLDETLIVANTMRSFEDRIEALQRKINSEVDAQRINGMLAEIKRYQDDKVLLKQYAESDQVVDNGKVINAQSEVVPALSDSHQQLIRPLIRLQDRNIVLTRINPMIRDTSVLVRLRPAWEDLRSYLTARGRKRFEVYVCTMAERDYALEMWRLLDPDANLISTKELLSRIVCVKSGMKKSLFNVFQDGICHPKMGLVIDDRLKVWDEKDQPRVHVVPAFAPYYSPQAEANNAIPVLCVARNVACNVRGGFFKEFDEGLLQRISEVAYEDDIKNFLFPPDVSNYLISEDDASALIGKKDSHASDGMAGAEVERRLREAIASSAVPSIIPSLDPRLVPSLQYALEPPVPIIQPNMPDPAIPFPNKQLQQLTTVLKPLAQVGLPEIGLHSSPAREEGEVPESELDPDMRRRLLILQHGQDMRDQVASEAQFPIRPPMQVSVPRVQGQGWFPVEEDMSSQQVSRVVPPKEFPFLSEPMHIEKQHLHHLPFTHKVESPITSDRVLVGSQRFPTEALQRDERLRSSPAMSSYSSFSGEEASFSRSPSINREIDIDVPQVDHCSETPVGVLQDIAFKCGAKVEFKPSLVSSIDLQFCVEVFFAGEKVGEGIGKTRRDAQRQAAEGSLMSLAEKYMSRFKPDTSSGHWDGSRFPSANDNGFLSDTSTFPSASEQSRVMDPRMEGSRRSMGSISALKELCMVEGFGMTFQPQPQISASMSQKNEVYAQVEIDGQIWGKGIGLTWDEARAQAAEKALGSLKSMLGQYPHKRQVSPRPFQANKRWKQDYPRALQRIPSSTRYPKNASPVP